MYTYYLVQMITQERGKVKPSIYYKSHHTHATHTHTHKSFKILFKEYKALLSIFRKVFYVLVITVISKVVEVEKLEERLQNPS